VRHFVSRPVEPFGEGYAVARPDEPPVPSKFRWDDRDLEVKAVLRSWRSSKTDRGDVYLKRHWIEIETPQGERAELYYDRAARGKSRWWLYSFDDAPDS
jgi:hypothetical protein